MSVDNPTIGTGTGSATKWYSGDTEPTTSAPASPPAGSLYLRRDPIPAGGIPALYQNFGTAAAPVWRVVLGPAVFDVRRFGARGNGNSSEDDAPAITAAISAAAAAGRGVVYLPPGTYYVHSTIALASNDIAFVGAGAGLTTIRAWAQAANNVVEATTASRLLFRDFTIDANGPVRGVPTVFPWNGIRLDRCTDCSLVGVTVTGTRGRGPGASAFAFGVGSWRCTAERCLAIDCGTSTPGEGSDGFYFAGDEQLIHACRAINCYDSGFVLENANRSGVVGCMAVGCTSAGAVTVAGADDKSGNFVIGLTAIGAYGGFVLGSVLGAGNLISTKLAQLTIKAASGAAGNPGIQFREDGTGRSIDCSLTDIDIDGGAAQGFTAGLTIRAVDSLRVRDVRVRNTTSDPIQVNPDIKPNGCSDVIIDRADIVAGSDYGIRVVASTDVLVRDPVIQGAPGTPLPMDAGVVFVDDCPGAAVVGAGRIRNWRVARVHIQGTAQYPLVALLAQPGAFRQQVDEWRQNAVPASQTNALMSRSVREFVPVRAGGVTGLSVAASAAGSGGSVTLTVFKNAVATSASVTLTAGMLQKSATFPTDSVPFAAGDRLELRVSSAGWAPAGTVSVWGTLEIET